MINSYDKIIKRLIEYRKRIGVSQKKMGETVNLTQSYYCRLETGTNVISNDTLQRLMEADCDVDFLITGCTRKHTVLNELFEQCPPGKRAAWMTYVVWVLQNGIGDLEQYPQFRSYRQEIDLLAYELDERKESTSSIWQQIRKSNGLTQEKMAVLLNVNIKKYRAIEKEKKMADAMVLMNLYNELHYHPTLLLENKGYYLYTLNSIWTSLPTERQNRMIKMIEMGLEYLTEENSSDKED